MSLARRVPRRSPLSRLRVHAAALAAIAWLAPVAAWACPQCAGKADGGIAQYVALGVFVTFPFALAAVVTRIVKRGDGTRDQGDPGPVSPARREAQ